MLNEGNVSSYGEKWCWEIDFTAYTSRIRKTNSGSYYFQEKNITNLNYKELALFRKNNIGFILQNHALIEDKNIFDNVALPLLYGKASKEKFVLKY